MSNFDQNPARSETIPSHGLRSTPLSELTHSIQTGRIPNALLFSGAIGTGKNEAAFEFAKLCNCIAGKSLSCGQCPSCKKIDAGMHPDMIRLGLEETKKIISISQIRGVGRLLSAKPNEATHRMVLIQDAESMNVQAQNALLKVLEEPPENTFFILTAVRTAPLLPTILSRCRLFKFFALSADQIRKILIDQHGIPPQTAHIVSRTIGPDETHAIECAKGINSPISDSPISDSDVSDWQKLRVWIIREIIELMRGAAHLRGRKGLGISQKLSANPDRISDAMAIVRTVLRDLCIFKYDANLIVNLDFFDAFKDISQIHVYPTFLEWLKDLYETEKRLDSNSGHRLTLDRFFLKLSLPKGLTQI